MQSTLRFISLGYGYGVCANRITMILRSDRHQAQELTRKAKADGSFLNCTHGRKMRTILMLDDGHTVGCAFSPATVLARLQGATEGGLAMNEADMEEEDDDAEEPDD